VILTGDSDSAVRLWSLGGELRFTFHGHGRPVTGCAFSVDRTFLASASLDGTVRRWRRGPPTEDE
jgi:WD40 repeat protein